MPIELEWKPDLTGLNGPKYKRIADAVARDIASGHLAEGTRLPPQRNLAWALGVTIGTVTRAYQEVERRGLVSGEVGRGTYVRRKGIQPVSSQPTALQSNAWHDAFQTPTVDDDIVSVASSPETGDIDFSFAGLPPGLEGAYLKRTLQSLMETSDLSDFMSYWLTNGGDRVRHAGTKWMAISGLKVNAGNIVATAGAQHGLMTAITSIVPRGGRVATEYLCHPGLRAVARMQGLDLIGLPLDREGITPDGLQKALDRGGIDAVCLSATLHNPTAATMSESRRRAIAEILERTKVPLIEDDVFGLLKEDAPAPITSVIPDQSIFITSISKTVSPGLRVGFAHVNDRVLETFRQNLRATLLSLSPLTIEIAARWIMDGTAEGLLLDTRQRIANRQTIFRRVLADADFDMPDGALHAWLHLPEPWRASQFVAAAAERGVKLTPAHAFSLTREGAPFSIRICLGPPRSDERLEEGFEIIADLLRDTAPISPNSVI